MDGRARRPAPPAPRTPGRGQPRHVVRTPPCRAATRGYCVVTSRHGKAWPCLALPSTVFESSGMVLPGLLVSGDCVEGDQHFAHDSDQGDLSGALVLFDEPLIE